MKQRDTVGNNGTGQPHDNYMTVPRAWMRRAVRRWVPFCGSIRPATGEHLSLTSTSGPPRTSSHPKHSNKFSAQLKARSCQSPLGHNIFACA